MLGDLWRERESAISFPEGVNWADQGYFKVTCETEVTCLDAPIPAGAVPLILEKAALAFEKVKAKGNFADEVRRYFKIIDPEASELVDVNAVPGRATDMVIFLDGTETRALFGCFGEEMISEMSRIAQLSTDCFGVFNPSENHWEVGGIDEEGMVGLWASPCLGTASD